MEFNYPLFRKYKNSKSYFKIFSSSLFEELKITGSFYGIITIEVKTLPERNFLSDMTYDFQNHWIEINGQEYEGKKKYCLQNLKLFNF